MSEYAQELVLWFEESQRSFPWRENRTPYKVLVSEIMLQQTLASVVVDYFNRWVERFPDFKALAEASEEEVIKQWEGLGYYSRARNLHGIAKRVMKEFDGKFPSSIDQILSFKGIGPYTAAAVSHFAFGKRELGCDGNIKKVLARFYGARSRIDNDKEFIDLLHKFLPDKDHDKAFEGLIELGATYCSKKPQCSMCPLSGGCVSYAEDLTELIPLRKKREKTIHLHRAVFILEHEGRVLLKKEEKKLMKGLVEFPYLEFDGTKEISDLVKLMEKQLGCKVEVKAQLEKSAHTFTKYKAFLTPYVCSLKTLPTEKKHFFVDIEKLDDYPFSSGHRKIKRTLLLAR